MATHTELVEVAARWLKRQGCHVVLTEHDGGYEPIVPDAIGWRRHHSIVVEVKVSRSDFAADRKKPNHRQGWSVAAEQWYLTPAGLLTAADAADLPRGWGLLEWAQGRVRRRIVTQPWPRSADELSREICRLVAELRRYQAQGLKYLPLSQLSKPVVKPTDEAGA